MLLVNYKARCIEESNFFRMMFKIIFFSLFSTNGVACDRQICILLWFCRHKVRKVTITMPGEETANATNGTHESRATLRFAKLSENAYAPTRGSKQAAGFDLYSAYDITIPAQGKGLAKTDIQIALPDGCYGRVAPRSGLAVKHFIDVGAGVIDQDYRGNVGVVMFNFGDQDFEVKKGDRIAQLILERIFIPDLQELGTLDETERGAGGFGSTGKN